MARITDTQLYKGTCHLLPKDMTRKQYAKELAKVKAAYQFISWYAADLNEAFLWNATPQGFAFWDKLCRQMVVNKEKYEHANH